MIKDFIRDLTDKALLSSGLQSKIETQIVYNVERPSNPKFGDLSTNVSMAYTKKEKKSPLDIAAKLVEFYPKDGKLIKEIKIAKPGFINFYLNTQFLSEQVAILKENPLGIDFNKLGNGKSVYLEFVSANPTGPLHIGHGRGAVVGDSLARLLKAAGFKVHTEYYVNNAGNQMDKLGQSVYLRFKEMNGEKVDFPDDGYQGDYIKDIASSKEYRDAVVYLSDTEDTISVSSEVSARLILGNIRESLVSFGVNFDNWFSEKSLFEDKSVSNCISKLEEKKMIYEDGGAKWIRSTDFGDEKDRVVVRDNGNPTYLASDIAYHKFKFENKFDEYINIWGSDHHGYLPRVKASIEMLGFDSSLLDVLFIQFVSLKRGSEKVQMSTRSGEFEELSVVLEEVGVDTARFFFLMRSPDSTLEFDLDLAKTQSNENPVFYVQYAYARTSSLFEQAKQQGIDIENIDGSSLKLLNSIDDHKLFLSILEWPECLVLAVKEHEPHHIVFSLISIAKNFHGYYNQNRFLSENKEITCARLYLAKCVREIIRRGLELIGVGAPEKM